MAYPSHETINSTGVSPYPAVAPLVPNDPSVTQSNDLSPHIPIGIAVQLPVTITITNGITPQNIPVSLSLLGPPVCDPRLVPIAADADTTPDILTGPTILIENQVQLQSTRLDWVELGMQTGEVRITQRMYQVNCPAGDWTMQLVTNIYPQGDPNVSNNQDQNQPVVHADIPDSDQDTIQNNQDNCPYVANPNQLNTDADSEGNACDNDDDNDGIDDGPESAPECTNDIDDDADTVVNDGCPQVVAFLESGVNSCNDSTDAPDEDPDPPVVQDDLLVNDGCPVAGED
ncbi:MAG: thrombospondin type 3 repeat-containing protein, partial [Acidimicrobiia bacterium]